MKAPLGYCSEPGCSVRVNGRCPAHDKARAKVRDARRAPSFPLLHTSRWTKYSKRRLAQFPWCVGYPSGVHVHPVLATCTDHKVPAKARPDLFWDPTNHQSLCADCNRRKAIAEEGGFGR